MNDLEKQVKAFTNYLWSRKRPAEAVDLRQKAQQVEQKLREEVALTQPNGECGLGRDYGWDAVSRSVKEESQPTPPF